MSEKEIRSFLKHHADSKRRSDCNQAKLEAYPKLVAALRERNRSERHVFMECSCGPCKRYREALALADEIEAMEGK